MSQEETGFPLLSTWFYSMFLRYAYVIYWNATLSCTRDSKRKLEITVYKI